MSKILRTQSDGAHFVRLSCFRSEWVVRFHSGPGPESSEQASRCCHYFRFADKD